MTSLYKTSLYKTSLYKTSLYKTSLSHKNRSTNAGALAPERGFTLIELMVTCAVLAIIVAIAAPVIRTQLAQMEARRIKHQLKNALTVAKSESYVRRQNLIFCLSDHQGRCHRDSDKQLLLFVDNDNNKQFDGQVDLLITQQALHLKYSKLYLRVGAKRHYVKFWGDSGQPRGHFGHIKYCPTVDYNKAVYLISFSQTGLITQKLNKDHPTKCL